MPQQEIVWAGLPWLWYAKSDTFASSRRIYGCIQNVSRHLSNFNAIAFFGVQSFCEVQVCALYKSNTDIIGYGYNYCELHSKNE